MEQMRIILKRLRKPSVIISLLAQAASIVMVLNLSADMDMISGIVLSACSVFVILGILSNPSTRKKGYGDDILLCSGQNRQHEHVEVAGKMVCTECGCANGEDKLEECPYSLDG